MAEASVEKSISDASNAVSAGRLQLDRDIFERYTMANFNEIMKPTSYAGLTGFLPTDYRGPYAGMAAWATMMDTANMFGTTGTDPRWAQLGYGNNMPTMAGAQQQSDMAARDTQMGMEYGGTFVGGTQAPPWMAPHATWAREFARTHQGTPPTQEQLTKGINDDVNAALQGLRANPEHQGADQQRRLQMEAQSVSGVLGMTPQNAASMVQDLRRQTANAGGRQSTALEIVDAASRWQNPTDPAMAINQAMTRLREDPAYQAAGGEQRRQMESQQVAQATGLPLEAATGIVNDLRSNTSVSGGLSQNEAVNRAVSRAMGTAPGGPTQAMYGQAGYTGGAAGAGAGAGAGPAPGAGGTAGAGWQPGGISFTGSNAAATSYNQVQAMSPEQRRLAEQARQTDINAQLSLRQQDIQNSIAQNAQKLAELQNVWQEAVARGNLALAEQTQRDLVAYQKRGQDLEQARDEVTKQVQYAGLTGTFEGQETQAAKEARLAAEARSGEISGVYGGQETLAARTQRQQNELGRMQLLSTLRGPEDIVQYARVSGGLQGGLESMNDAALGRFQVAAGEGGAGATSPATLQGLGQDIGGVGPAGYQQYGGQQGYGGNWQQLQSTGENQLQQQFAQQQATGQSAQQLGIGTFEQNQQGAAQPGYPPQPMPESTGGLPAAQQTSLYPPQQSGAEAAQYNARRQRMGGLSPPVNSQGQSNAAVLRASQGLASPSQWAWQNVERMSPTNQKMLTALSEGQGRRVEDIQAEHQRVLGRYGGPRSSRQATQSGF